MYKAFLKLLRRIMFNSGVFISAIAVLLTALGRQSYAADVRAKISPKVKNLRKANPLMIKDSARRGVTSSMSGATADGYYLPSQGQVSGEIPDQYSGTDIEIYKRPVSSKISDGKFYLGFNFRRVSVANLKFSSDKATLEDGSAATGDNFANNVITLKDGDAFSGSVGFYFPTGLRIEYEYSKINSEISSIDNRDSNVKFLTAQERQDIDNPSLTTKPEDDELELMLHMLNVLFTPNLNKKFGPYFGFGIGSASITIADDRDLKDTTLAGQGLIGLQYRNSAHGAFHFGYRYLVTRNFGYHINKSNLGNTKTFLNSTQTINIEHNVSAHNFEIGYKFDF